MGDDVIRVLIADDQPLVRMGLRGLINSEPDLDLVGEADTGGTAVEAISRLRPDVVLMDIRMPHTDGLSALRTVTADPALAAVRVIMMTTFELDEYVFAALEAGAAGFLIKDAEPVEMLRAIRTVASGESLLSPTVTSTVIRSFVGRTRVEAHPRLSELTEREREIVALVGEGLSNEEIAQRLWISKATARTHVSRAMIKLAARDRAQLVVIAHRSGLVR